MILDAAGAIRYGNPENLVVRQNRAASNPAEVRRLAVMPYCQGQSAFGQVTELLNEFGITIAKRTVIQLGNEQPKLLEEADEVLEAGFSGTDWGNVDNTGVANKLPQANKDNPTIYILYGLGDSRHLFIINFSSKNLK